MTKDIKYITPKNTLKEKVGDGGIPPHVLKQSQNYLESNPIDYLPYARAFLKDLETINETLKKKPANTGDALKKIMDIVMQLKSSGGMFQYQLISMVSDVMLNFLDRARNSDQDFLDIIDVYLKTLNIIVNKKLMGSTGREGFVLTQELHNACVRYYAKYGL